MARRPQRVEPCHHCWAYYQRKVNTRRKAKLPCSQLENLMWDYSLHAAYAFGIVQGAPDKWHDLSSGRARKSVTPDTDPNLCVDPIW
jgi:hypothetical protein